MSDGLRVTVRFRSREELEAIERAAKVAGIGNGALLRECGLRWGASLAAAIRSGDPRAELPRRGRNRSAS